MSTLACPATVRSRDAQGAVDRAMLAAVRAVQLGDEARFEEIYRGCFDRVYALAYSLLGDEHAAEDVVQETFLAALRALPRFRPQPGVPFVAWLLRIARNGALMRLRATSRLTVLEPEVLAERLEQRASSPATEAADQSDIGRALAGIPARQQQVLLLRFTFDLSAADVARVMNTTPAGVRQLQRRALASLRERIREPGEAAASA
jgi:RNA polymerase sigma-70 factor, ECF subfamily